MSENSNTTPTPAKEKADERLQAATGSAARTEIETSTQAVVEICHILEKFPDEIRLRIFKACEILLK